jgi:hypothetical protein
LVCLQHFQGKGYNGAFVSAVEKIVSALTKDYHEKIVSVVDRCDDVCKHCPKMVNNRCIDEIEIMELDTCFSGILGLSAGNIVTPFEIREITRKKLSPTKFQKVCGNCRWFDLCHKY